MDNLVQEVFNLCEKLTASINRLKENGVKLAQAESNYKITLRTEALKLRQEKGMPVTLISQIIYGVPEVAKLRLERDIAETVYETNKEYINVTKLQLKVLENQIQREWGAKSET